MKVLKAGATRLVAAAFCTKSARARESREAQILEVISLASVVLTCSFKDSERKDYRKWAAL